MNVDTTVSIGKNAIQANEVQQQNKDTAQKKPQEAKQSARNVADKVTISAKGKEAKQINATANASLGEVKTASEAHKKAGPAASRILGTNLLA